VTLILRSMYLMYLFSDTNVYWQFANLISKYLTDAYIC